MLKEETDLKSPRFVPRKIVAIYFPDDNRKLLSANYRALRKIRLAKIFRSSKINLLLRCKTNLLQIGKCHQEFNIWNVYGYYVSSLMLCWELNYDHFDNIIQRSWVTNVPRDAGGLVWKINLSFSKKGIFGKKKRKKELNFQIWRFLAGKFKSAIFFLL